MISIGRVVAKLPKYNKRILLVTCVMTVAILAFQVHPYNGLHSAPSIYDDTQSGSKSTYIPVFYSDIEQAKPISIDQNNSLESNCLFMLCQNLIKF